MRPSNKVNKIFHILEIPHEFHFLSNGGEAYDSSDDYDDPRLLLNLEDLCLLSKKCGESQTVQKIDLKAYQCLTYNNFKLVLNTLYFLIYV